ncbi:hypothetical protein [Streptomyces griseus]|uniref:hypothetical protein n=1 Tax=Streptomyces griseus TaxID=1911 RepID=UPI0037A6A3E7
MKHCEGPRAGDRVGVLVEEPAVDTEEVPDGRSLLTVSGRVGAELPELGQGLLLTLSVDHTMQYVSPRS